MILQLSSIFLGSYLFREATGCLADTLGFGNAAKAKACKTPNKAFQTDEFAVSHLLQKAQKLRHNNFAAEQRR
jgi:hypothetical protein